MRTQITKESPKPAAALRALSKKTARPHRRAEKAVVGPVLWALDPTLKAAKDLKSAYQLIKIWRMGTPAALIPVSTMSPLDIGWPDGTVQTIDKTNPSIISHALAEILSTFDVTEEPKVLIRDSSSTESAVQAVLAFAKKEKASAILVNSSGRTGFRRLGSFTERLTSESPVPVLSVSPKSRVPAKISRILFATDLSAPSRKLFAKILDLAVLHRATVTIFYQNEPYVSAYISGGDGSADSAVLEAYTELQKERRKMGLDWTEEAKDLGVKAEFVFSKRSEPTAKAIIRVAKQKKASLIAMGSRGGHVAKLLLGSTVRDVMAAASQPVYVCPETGAGRA